MVSLPVPPFRVLLPELPVSVLASVLPVPLMLPRPVRVRFSTLVPSVKLTLALTVSVPPLLVPSVTTSPVIDHEIRIVARPTDHRVVAYAAVDLIAEGSARDGVGT